MRSLASRGRVSACLLCSQVTVLLLYMECVVDAEVHVASSASSMTVRLCSAVLAQLAVGGASRVLQVCTHEAVVLLIMLLSR
jgi:hypothetical protein